MDSNSVVHATFLPKPHARAQQEHTFYPCAVKGIVDQSLVKDGRYFLLESKS